MQQLLWILFFLLIIILILIICNIIIISYNIKKNIYKGGGIDSAIAYIQQNSPSLDGDEISRRLRYESDGDIFDLIVSLLNMPDIEINVIERIINLFQINIDDDKNLNKIKNRRDEYGNPKIITLNKIGRDKLIIILSKKKQILQPELNWKSRKSFAIFTKGLNNYYATDNATDNATDYATNYATNIPSPVRTFYVSRYNNHIASFLGNQDPIKLATRQVNSKKPQRLKFLHPES